MTEDWRVSGGNEKYNRLRSMNGDTPQARVSRYKDERRKQLAGQFANLLRNHDNNTNNTSSSTTSDTNCHKTTTRVHTSNGVKEDENSRKLRPTNNSRCTNNKVRCIEESSDTTESRKKTNGSVTCVDSSKNNNRDKSAKRKSFLNRSANTEKTPPSNGHSHNHHHNRLHYQSSDEKSSGGGRGGAVGGNGTSRIIVPSSLPIPVTTPSTSSSTSSQKLSPSRSHRKKLVRSAPLSSQPASNGFAHTNTPPSSSSSSRRSPCGGVPQQTSSAKQSKDVKSNSACDKLSATVKLLRSSHSTSMSKVGSSKSPDDVAACDKQSSDFRFRHTDSSSSSRFLQESTFGNDKPASAFATPPSPPSNNASRTAESQRSDNGFENRSHSEGTTNTPPADPNEQLFSHKNPLLQIIQNFSQPNIVAQQAPSNGSHNCNPEIGDAKRSVSSFKLPNVKNDAASVAISCSLPASQNLSLEIIEEDNATAKPSILKKKFDERSVSLDTPRPNSILKRNKTSAAPSVAGDDSNNTYPSLSVSGVHKQGILKKNSSLDEEEVRRRSCSPDVDLGRLQEFKPILKSQRRSSCEELLCSPSPELHSILKRSKQQNEDTSDSNSTSPHGILKRKVSIINGHYERRSADSETTSDTESPMRPILKNKQHSFEVTTWENCASGGETPKPILKKNHFFLQPQVADEKPNRPILKSSFRSLDEADAECYNSLRFTDWSLPEGHRCIKPILKKSAAHRMMDTRNVKSDDDMAVTSNENVARVKRHSLPGPGIVMRRSFSPPERDHQLSIIDNLVKLEQLARAKRQTDQVDNVGQNFQLESQYRNARFSRNCERYKTQPITYDELVSTRNSIQDQYPTNEKSFSSMMELNDSEEVQTKPHDSASKDGDTDRDVRVDEKEMISNLKRSNSVSAKASLFAQLAKESAKVVEGNQLKKSGNNGNRRKLKVRCSDLSSRFATQPVTWDEVAEAKKQNLDSRDKAADVRKEIQENVNTGQVDVLTTKYRYVPISERVKMFATKLEETTSTRSRRSGSRFNTQPVTENDIQIAKLGVIESTNDVFETAPDSVTAATTAGANDKISKLKVLPADTKKRLSAAKSHPRKSLVENSSEASSQSEGDTSSSGGREIQSIIGKHDKSTRANKNRTGKMNYGSVVAAGGTDMVDECPVINGNSSIAQRLAALQKSGQLDWKKRISRMAPEKEVSPIIKINESQELLKKELSNGFRCKISGEVHIDEKNDGSLAERLEKLETARQTWKKRVEPSDAVQFSVVGKMASNLTAIPAKLIPTTSPLTERKKRGPAPSRFRSFREQKKENQSEPASPEKSKSATALNRSNSLPSESNDEDTGNETKCEEDTVINVPQIFDDDFCTFFGQVEPVLLLPQNIDSQDSDFSAIKSEAPRLLPTHKKIRAQRKHATSGNPLKNMATKIEIMNEYREVKTNVAEREIKRINVEKLSKNSSLAVEVLAGLASKEDFLAVQLKKAAPLSSPMLPYKSLMLLHIKGRRHVQTRLIEPVVHSINSGDSYILINHNEIYHWIGQFSNVIERSRSAEIAQHIVSTHDLGCGGASQLITIAEESTKNNQKHVQQFWTCLGATPEQASGIKVVPAGHPDEDEVYESSLISTNMVYEVTASGDELVPMEKYWGSIAKIHMLDPNKVLVFDFGGELYVWMGKNVDMKLRKSSVKLARELWENGFNYGECDLCPITSSRTIGGREVTTNGIKKQDSSRPEWCLFAKVTQHMETVLFREKFLDWPDFSRVIRAKGKDTDIEKQTDSNFDVSPCDAKEMLQVKMTEPDLVLEGSHLGRGCQYFDEERKLFYSITTSEVRMWHIAEFESEEVEGDAMGQFCSTYSYVIKWVYSISYSGRELNGQPSKHTTMGRDRCVYFCWQGKNASLNEQGAAALLTSELDEEKGIQLRICQGYEPPAFFNLFKGRAIIYRSKRLPTDKEWRLFICQGEVETEAVLLEVSCNIRQLRSRASFMLINVNTGIMFVWHGCKVSKSASKICHTVINKLTESPPVALGLSSDAILKLNEINEGSEPKDFFKGVGSSSRKLYTSLLDDKEDYDTTPLLFSLSSSDGAFNATPIWSPCRHTDIVTAYPFLQEDLYSANQPALLLMDSGKELWLWQGWWPERETMLDGDQAAVTAAASDEGSQNCDKDRGSATIRWQAERRAAMQTALDYWQLKYAHKPSKAAYLVWAGLEPIQFTNLFADWQDRDDVAEMNIMDGRKPGEVLDVEQELERLTQSTYPIEQLLQRPLPDGVDPTKLELYLSVSHFKEILEMTKDEFATLPSWKQTNLKKNVGLF